jgi:hypothetical protein
MPSKIGKRCSSALCLMFSGALYISPLMPQTRPHGAPEAPAINSDPLKGDPRPPIGDVASRLDADKDGLRDSYEAYLLQKFAPKIWLHKDERSLPVNVRWLLEQSRLRFSHAGGCFDHGLLDWGHVSHQNLTAQRHRNANEPPWCLPWNCCEHEGSERRSDNYTAVPKKSFFLQFTDASHDGLRNPRDWELYGHVFLARDGQIAIQYWQLYAYNDSVLKVNHEGDWEFSAVRIDRDERPIKIAHYRHGHIVESNPDEVEWEGQHHISYSAKGSHSQYRTTESGSAIDDTCAEDGVSDEFQGNLVAHDKCGRGIGWTTWARPVVNIGEKSFPMGDANWIRFSGRWGEIGAAAVSIPGFGSVPIEFTSGPQGPAYQEAAWQYWHTTEVCDNGVDDDIDGSVDNCPAPPMPRACPVGRRCCQPIAGGCLRCVPSNAACE